jgi:predicted Co/Zn/Cd cation transporter (cation efflux family)
MISILQASGFDPFGNFLSLMVDSAHLIFDCFHAVLKILTAIQNFVESVDRRDCF